MRSRDESLSCQTVTERTRGRVEDPLLTLDNAEIARRHVAGLLLQRYHQVRIDSFGVGLALGVSSDAPVLGSVYKLVAYDGPGAQAVRGQGDLARARASVPSRGLARGLRRARRRTAPPDTTPLLIEVMRAGKRTEAGKPGVAAAAATFEQQWRALPKDYKSRVWPRVYPVRLTPGLQERTKRIDAELGRRSELGAAASPEVDRC